MPLWQQMLWAMLAGLIVGFIISPHGFALMDGDHAITIGEWLALPGMIFLALIKMVVIPLVATSISLAIADSRDVESFKENGLKVGGYFVMTTSIAVCIGIALALIIRPGGFISPDAMLTAEAIANRGKIPELGDSGSLPSMIANIFPTNPIKSIVDFNMVHIVVASILAGIAMLSLGGKKSKPLADILTAILDVSMQIVYWAMLLAPIAVFGFLANLAIKVGADTLSALSVYIGTVLLGLIMILAMYMIIVTVFARRSPWQFLKDIRAAQILAFSTSSSAATMPLSLKVAEEKLNIHPEVSRFVIPMGTTINMDGTAIYQIIAGLFLAQVFGIDLTLTQMFILSVTIVGASIGSPGSPGVGLVILASILSSIGVSPEGIAMILAVDRILDMCRTTINVTGDLTAASVMERWMVIK